MNKPKPIFGITGPSVFSDELREMTEKYFGAIPLELKQNGAEDIKQIFDLCDAIILGGGNDLYPSSINVISNGEKRELMRGCGYTKFDKQRDEREIELIKLAEKFNKPVLAICRGFQLMMAQKGFYLIPDISSYDVIHSPREIEVNGEPIHYVRCEPEFKKEFFDKEMVNSFHHQAIYYVEQSEADKVGVDILGTSNLCYEMGKQEAVLIIEMARGKNWLGVQFHPEANYETNRASKIILDKFKKMVFTQ